MVGLDELVGGVKGEAESVDFECRTALGPLYLLDDILSRPILWICQSLRFL